MSDTNGTSTVVTKAADIAPVGSEGAPAAKPATNPGAGGQTGGDKGGLLKLLPF